MDYLVIPDAPRRPLHSPTNAWPTSSQPSPPFPDGRTALLTALDALVAKTRLDA